MYCGVGGGKSCVDILCANARIDGGSGTWLYLEASSGIGFCQSVVIWIIFEVVGFGNVLLVVVLRGSGLLSDVVPDVDVPMEMSESGADDREPERSLPEFT